MKKIAIAAIIQAVTPRKKEFCLIVAKKPEGKEDWQDHYDKVIDLTINDLGMSQDPTPKEVATFVRCYQKRKTTVLYASQELVNQLNELGVTPDIVYVV